MGLPMPDRQTVHVVDDDSAVRESLAYLLASAKIKVRTHDSAEAFLDVLPTLAPGCIITDVRMPGLSGIDLLKRLKKTAQAIPVIVITGHGDVPLAVEAMRLGAMDFLEKPFDDLVLIASVRSALNNRETAIQHGAKRTELLDRLATLSLRERQVLEGLVAGNPNKTIAFDLSISPRTVEIYRAHVMTKMKAASLSDLVRMAILAGILDNMLDK
jgi:two-component system response regulator FixJ